MRTLSRPVLILLFLIVAKNIFSQDLSLNVNFFDYQKDALWVYMGDGKGHDWEEVYDTVFMRIKSEGIYKDLEFSIEINNKPTPAQYLSTDLFIITISERRLNECIKNKYLHFYSSEIQFVPVKKSE